jgi:T-complex protein 1 subunit delta
VYALRAYFTFLFSMLKMDNQVIVSDYTQMDRVLREERQYILDLCKKIKKAGCNVLLIQKSILRYMLVHFSKPFFYLAQK